MNPKDIIAEYYDPKSKTFEILVQHGSLVAEKALRVAEKVSHLNPDISFIEESAMLHDIGIFKTDTPSLGCFGNLPYICHGIVGKEVLESKGLARHARVCERHIGIGISADEIDKYRLPLPKRDMIPLTIEEIIVCYADKFFSKNKNLEVREKSISDILNRYRQFGEDKMNRLRYWIELFESAQDSGKQI